MRPMSLASGRPAKSPAAHATVWWWPANGPCITLRLRIWLADLGEGAADGTSVGSGEPALIAGAARIL
jgi:hypothetical protein